MAENKSTGFGHAREVELYLDPSLDQRQAYETLESLDIPVVRGWRLRDLISDGTGVTYGLALEPQCLWAGPDDDSFEYDHKEKADHILEERLSRIAANALAEDEGDRYSVRDTPLTGKAPPVHYGNETGAAICPRARSKRIVQNWLRVTCKDCLRRRR